jgi:hypothetical protein
MTKAINEKVKQKISENPNTFQERKEYLETVKNFMNENLPAENYRLSKKIEYPIVNQK